MPGVHTQGWRNLKRSMEKIPRDRGREIKTDIEIEI